MDFPLPKTSFNNTRLVLQAAYMSNKKIITTKEWSTVIKGRDLEEDVTRCRQFFLEIGLLQNTEKRLQYQLTDELLQLGKAIQAKDEISEIRIWKSIIERNMFFKLVLDKIDFYEGLNGFVEMRKIKEEIISLAGKEEESKTNAQYFDAYAPAIVNLLKHTGFIENIHKTKIKRVSNENKTIKVAPIVFKIPTANVETDLVAVMMPFSAEFNDVYKTIKQGCQDAGFRCKRVDDVWEESTIVQDIFNLIFRAQIVIVDFTGKNPNVMYETGIAHTLGKQVIPLSQSLDSIPFDMTHHRVLKYLPNKEGLEDLKTNLSKKLRQFDV